MLGLAQMYNVRPSTLLFISDEYTAFCFDEACGYIQAKILNKEEPEFKRKESETGMHYSSFSELAKQIERKH